MEPSRDRDRYEAWIREQGSDPDRPLIPAATVVPLRDTPDGIETLLVRRNSKVFFGGMWVFPGGKVDPDDVDPHLPDDPLAAARRAAAREAKEEADLEVAASDLVRLSHWVPPGLIPKRFATWFFLTRAPDGDVVIDGGEIHDHAWWRPEDALARRERLEIELLPPTFVTLHDLSAHATVDEALAWAAGRDPDFYATRIYSDTEGSVAVWNGDAAYEDGHLERSGPRNRLAMTDTGWRLLRTMEGCA